MKKMIINISIIVLISLFAIMPSCDSNETTAPSLTASEVLSKTIENMNAINSFHFELIHDGGRTPIAMGLELDEAKGNMVKPDKLQATILAALRGILLEVQVITIGTTTYMTNPLTKKWEHVPGEFSAISIFDPNAGITAILEDMSNPSIVESQDNNMDNSYHVKGQIPSESLRPITLSSVENISITGEVWIDKESYLINQIKVVGQITESEKSGIARILKLSDYNLDVVITAPLET